MIPLYVVDIARQRAVLHAERRARILPHVRAALALAAVVVGALAATAAMLPR